MSYLWFVFAGLALFNSIPHLAAGLMGQPHRTPFANPPGRGLSPAWVNVLWGAANLALGVWLVRRGLGEPEAAWPWIVIGAGTLGGLVLARPRRP